MRLLRSPRVVYTLVGLAAVGVPFATVTFPPITDLPQHLAQVRLFLEAVHHPAGPLVIQWWTPYTLAYVLLGGLWAILPPLVVGRVAFALVGGTWVASVAWLGRRLDRSPALPLLAVMLYFGAPLYWGFLPFLLGFPLFIVWHLRISRPMPAMRWRDGLEVLALALLLFTCHVLWLAAALGWLGLRFLLGRGPRRTSLLQGLAALPVAVLTAFWYPHLRHGGFVSRTRFGPLPWARLAPGWLAHEAFAGLGGSTPFVMLAALAAVLGVAVYQARRRAWAGIDTDSLLIAGLLGACVLFLPMKLQNTIEFSARWLGPALLFLALGLPAPRLLRRGQGVAFASLGAAFALATALTWIGVSRTSLPGLLPSLEAVRPGSRLVELDFPGDTSVRGRPYMQVMAYAQAMAGCRLSFSFAQFADMPVVDRRGPIRPWTPGLEWYPERVRRADLAHFDAVLFHGSARLQAAFQSHFPVVPVTPLAPWRLFRVTPARAAATP